MQKLYMTPFDGHSVLKLERPKAADPVDAWFEVYMGGTEASGFYWRQITSYRLLPKASEPAVEDGWIPWAGGECPVPKGVLLHVKTARGWDSSANNGRPSDYQSCTQYWTHTGPVKESNIIAYRIAKE